VRKKMNIKYSIKYFLERSDGIGSKKIKPSKMIHSYSTKSRYLEVIHKFVDFCLYENINRIDRITTETLRDYFETLENYSVKTLKVHLSALKKYFSVLERQDLIKTIEDLRPGVVSQGRERTQIQGFVNPEKVINAVKGEEFKAIATIQLTTGARIGDIKKISVDEKENKVIISRSKGGRTREIKLNKEEIEKVKEALEKIDFSNWKELRIQYYSELKKAVQKAGEVYTGAHAFRANFAQNRYNLYLNMGFSEKEAVKAVSHDLGHNRLDISKYYILRG